MRAKDFIPASKPRNFVAKNSKTAGAGAHKDKKRAEKQGDVKHKKPYDQGVAEGMAGKVVFSGTGANGGTYEIIQSGPTDFMIHANGRHIDTYGSLQRAMSVLKNEVPGLQQGVAEGLPQTLRKVVPGYAKREIDRKMDAEKFGRTDVDRDANYYRYKKIQDKIKKKG